MAQVELTCLGRVVAQATGSPGALSLNPTALAPGDNVIVPLAIYGDGMQVAGGAFVVHVESGPVNSWSNAGASGLWSNPANWTGGVLPQNGDNVARFSGAASGGTVTVDTSATVEEIDLDNSGGGGYTIAALPGQTLTLSSTNGVAAECLVNVLSGSHTISAPLVLASPGNLVNVTNPADRLTVSGGISGSGALTKTGAGLLLLTGSETYCGATTISAGTLQLGNGTSGHDVCAGSSGVSDGSVLVCDVFASQTADYPIGGAGSLVKLGPGTLTLAGSNSYAGGTTIRDGALLVLSPQSLADGALIIGAGGSFIFDPTASSQSTGGPATPAIGGSGPGGASFPSPVNAVPEPGTIVLLLAALGSAGIYQRFSFRQKAFAAR